jgi:MscS family membrane protein
MEVNHFLEILALDGEHDWIVYLGVSFLVLLSLPLSTRLLSGLLCGIFERVGSHVMRPAGRRLIVQGMWMLGFGVSSLVSSPVLALGRSYVEVLYLKGVATFFIVSGMMVATSWVEYFFLDRLSSLTGLPLNWSEKIVSGLGIFLGLSIILDHWGLAIAPILGSFGLLGIAVGLGAQDLFSNLISGLLIILEKRLKEGDVVEVGGVVGTVKQVNLRSTLLEQFDMTPTYIPNGIIAGAVSTNLTRKPHRRIMWDLGLEYRTGASALRGIRDAVWMYIRESEDFLGEDEATCMVRLDNFGDSSVNMKLVCFAKTADYLEWMDVKERLLLRVKEIVEDEHGASFAFPSLSLYNEKELVLHKSGGEG